MSALPSQLRLTASEHRQAADLYAQLSDAERIQVDQRRAIVDAWRGVCRDFAAAGRTKAEATQVFLAAHNGTGGSGRGGSRQAGGSLSQATLYRWADRRDSDDPTDLLDRRKNKEANASGPRTPDTVSADAWQLFLRHWLDIRRPSINLCWQIVAHQAAEHGWTWPSCKTIERKIAREVPPFKSDYFRLGQKEWHRKHAPKLHRDYSQVRAGEHWIGDCHEFDVFCRKSDTDPTLCRPILSAFTDLRSRMLAGWYIGLSESSTAVVLAIRDGVDRMGVPDQMTIDNGKPYRAYGVSGGRPTQTRKVEDEERVRSVLGGLGIITHFSIPFNPDSKPIERFFGTVECQFGVTFRTYCGGDKDDRFRAAHKLATDDPMSCPTVAQLTEQFGRWVVAFHSTPHDGYGMQGLSPAEAFAAFDPIARKVAPAGAIDILLMKTVGGGRGKDGKLRGVKVGSYGVLYQGDYYGQGLAELQLMQGKEVLLRIDPVDAGYVIVCDLDGKPIVKAYNNRRLYSGVTQDDIAAGMKRRKRARELAKSVMDGGLRATMQDVTEAAIAARLASASVSPDAVAAATGTDDHRAVSPLRSDMAEAIGRYTRRVTPLPASPAAGPTIEQAAAMTTGHTKRNTNGRTAVDLADLDL